jgi:hypothetical protein
MGFLARASGQESAGVGRGNELIGRNVGARQREKCLGVIGVRGSRLFPDLQGSRAVAVTAQADAQQIEVLRQHGMRPKPVEDGQRQRTSTKAHRRASQEPQGGGIVAGRLEPLSSQAGSLFPVAL